MKTAYCIKCGNKFPEEAAFCPFCGTKVYRPEDTLEDNASSSIDEPISPEDDPALESIKAVNDVLKSAFVAETVNEDTPIEEDKTDHYHKSEETASPNPPVSDSGKTHLRKDDTVDEDELEDPKIGVCILSFFFPIIGFIAAISNRGKNKKKSRTYSMCAWIGFALNFISSLIQASV
jgi:hypothetical protein